jgi:transcriptional regulator with XRE-family HTH domain
MNPKIPHSIGRRIRDLRKRQRITQKELAAWLHTLNMPITRAMIANWETGRGEVSVGYIQLIAYSLGVKVADLLPDLTFKGVIAGQIMHSDRRRKRGQN